MMYALGHGLWKHLTQKRDYYIVIIGLENAGKTTFLEQTKMKFNDNYQMLNPLKITSTVGLNIGKIEFGPLRLNFWDLGGHEDLHSLWCQYFDDSHAMIFVIDGCDTRKFPLVEIVFRKIMESKAVQRMPILIICNKCDLEECIDTELIRKHIPDDLHCSDLAVIQVSALQGINIDHCLRWLYTVITSDVDTNVDLL